MRVSIYESTDWGGAITRLVDAGARAAANILVGPGNLDTLPTLLDRLRGLGCDNVALLRYVGPDRRHQLRGNDWSALERAIHRAPLPIRLSHCFADRMPDLPRRPLLRTEALSPGIRVYRGFSSINSGDTVLVARFATVDEPRALADLLAEMNPEERRGEWRDFLRAEGCSPDHQDYDIEVEAAGRSFLATGYDAGDSLPGIRDLVWRRRAPVVLSAVHLHEGRSLLVGLGGADGAAKASLESKLWTAGADAVERNADCLFATLPGDPWVERLTGARAIADARMRAVATHALQLPPDVVSALNAEKRHRAAIKHWDCYQTWKTDRNPARAELERQHGYDTKHAMHLIRLMRMGVQCDDADELCAIRPRQGSRPSRGVTGQTGGS